MVVGLVKDLEVEVKSLQELLHRTLEGYERRISELEIQMTDRVKRVEKFVDHDQVMKARFLSMSDDDLSDWEPWTLLYWFRFLRRQTTTKSVLTGWAQYQKGLQGMKFLLGELDTVVEVKDYLEYTVFGTGHPEDLSIFQVTSGPWLSKMSGQYRAWKTDREIVERLRNSDDKEVEA
jgi:hypothetical protein